MAYPEPTPAIKKSKAKEFHKNLDSFQLTTTQKRMYRDAKKQYKETRD